ncbi:DnaJ sub A member 3, mitochondrial [Coemansia sp. IMI 203386]|nr:DnaJ sub A member 3, mitochondrial [Coemansia sp. IMI 203386]
MFSASAPVCNLLKISQNLAIRNVQKCSFHSSRALQVVHRANHYAVLGVPISATQKEIKSAFYKSSMKWHPDRNHGSNEAHQKFLKISEAYSILSDENKRRAYDRSQQIRTGSYTGRTSAPHRYHNTAFSSSGEYSSSRPAPDTKTEGYRSPSSAYTGHSRYGRQRSNFEEWERQHYHNMKERADSIGRYAKDNAHKARYSNTQVTMYQFWELVAAATVVFGVAWAGSGFVKVSGEREGVARK